MCGPRAERVKVRVSFEVSVGCGTCPKTPSWCTIREILVNTDENLWVETYPIPGDTLPAWTVFDPNGVMLGDVRVPNGLRIFEFGSDYVLGVWQNGLDVPHVRMYELIKP